MVEKQVKSLSLGSTYGYANKLPQVRQSSTWIFFIVIKAPVQTLIKIKINKRTQTNLNNNAFLIASASY